MESDTKENRLEQEFEDEDNILCEVCHDGTVFIDNEILICEKCNVPVHQHCYGVSVIPENEWYCKACEAGLDPACLQCELCSNTGSIYVRTQEEGKWVHPLCSNWIPEVYTNENYNNNLEGLDKKRYKLKCLLCDKKGACVQCCYGRCFSAAHPWCVVRNPKGWVKRIVKDEEGEPVWEIFCKSHSSAAKEAYKPKFKAKAPDPKPLPQSTNLIAIAPPTKASSTIEVQKSYDLEEHLYRAKKIRNNTPTMAHFKAYTNNKILYKEASFFETIGIDRKSTGFSKEDTSDKMNNSYPILNMLEWPGQNEGEAMDLIHFWDVASSYFAEDHNLDWLRYMIETNDYTSADWALSLEKGLVEDIPELGDQ